MRKFKKISIGFFLATLCVLIFNGNISAATSAVTVLWNSVTTWTDGTPLTDPVGYKILYGTQSGVYSTTVDLGSALSYTVNLPCGVNYYFVAQTYVVANPSNTSAFSDEVVKNSACSTPSCVYTYSNWGACQPNGTQTMTILSAVPAGCTGTPLPLTQSCVYVPPACSFAYSAWEACQSDGTQTRTVLSSSPSGCAGSTPVTSQSCTYTPPANKTLAVHKPTYGTVTGNGINCGKGGSVCKGTYSSGAQITLTAKPVTGMKFHSWSGAVCSGGNPVCTFVISNNGSVTAVFGR